MRGAEGVAAAVTLLLAQKIEGRLAVLTVENGEVAGALPTLVSANPLPYEGMPVEQWPFVLVRPQTVPAGLVPLGPNQDGSRGFDVRYGLEVSWWVRGDSYQGVSAAQRRLGLGLREVVLTNQKVAEGIRLTEASLTERYSPVGIDQTLSATVGAGMLSFEVVSTERLSPKAAAFGAPTSVSADTGRLP